MSPINAATSSSTDVVLYPATQKSPNVVPLHPLRKDVCAVIPCYNEEATIYEVVRNVRRYLELCIVIDDGSSDKTSARAKAACAKVITLDKNQGKGAALKIGYKAAHESGCAAGITLDGDGQHDPREIPSFLALFDQEHSDVVLGNRMTDTSEMPLLRRATNRISSFWVSRLVGRSVPDSQCGFRLIRLKLWNELDLTGDRFDLETEFFLKALEQGAKMSVTPIETIYTYNSVSHFRPIADTWKIILTLARRSKVKS